MSNFNWLQFFADGGAPAGGEGAATGVDSGSPGQSLEDLGVPAEKAERFRQRRKKSAPPEAAPATETAAQPAETVAPDKPSTTWDDFMAVPENNKRLQQMMSDRVNKIGREQAEYMSKLNPALELIAGRYGLKIGEDGRYDPEALAKAVTEDDSYYEQAAADLGVDVDVARRITQLEAEKKRSDEQQQRQQREEQLREHFMSLQQQANDLQQIFPNFDLQRELDNPEFLRYTSPEWGMSVKQAFYALHGEEVQDKAVNAVAQRAKIDAANAIRSGVRPRENGTSATAPVSIAPNMKTMTPEERRAYIMAKYPPPG